jgi:hypothetical protein
MVLAAEQRLVILLHHPLKYLSMSSRPLPGNIPGILMTAFFSFVTPKIRPATTIDHNKDRIYKPGCAGRPAQPDLYVLAVGTKSNLRYPQRDARAIATLYANQAGRDRLFRHIRIDTLIGPAATGRNIVKVLSRLQVTGPGKKDVLLLFISCHGMTGANGLELIGSRPASSSSRSCISFNTDILERLKTIDCKKIILLDACHSGGMEGSKSSERSKVSEAISRLLYIPKGLAIVSSCNSKEESFEDPRWGHGAFTKAIIEGLREGKAGKNRQGIVYLDDLIDYIQNRVPQLLKKAAIIDGEGNPMQQHPTGQNHIGNIPLYLN